MKKLDWLSHMSRSLLKNKKREVAKRVMRSSKYTVSIYHYDADGNKIRRRVQKYDKRGFLIKWYWVEYE